METQANESALMSIEQALTQRYSREEIREWIHTNFSPYMELMSYYKCAIMEIETKFRVLNENFSLEFERNPIESIKTRLKTPESIVEKLGRLGYLPTVENIEQQLNDVAGIRVICAFQSDVYSVAEDFMKQDDIKVLQVKDYIENPKENGYRSLHLIVSVPIFIHGQKREVKAEVQLRTLAMDVWASLEHIIRYKKNAVITDSVNRDLNRCGNVSTVLDHEFERIFHEVYEDSNS